MSPHSGQHPAPAVVPSDAAGVAASALRALGASGGRRLGVDGAVPADAALFADAAAGLLAERGTPVLRVDAQHWLRPRSVRLETGADDPEAGYERWYDTSALLREVLDPLGQAGAGTWVARFWDADRDRATREPRRAAPDSAVLVLSGPFLLRWELAGALDAVVHLQTSPAAVRRRAGGADAERVVGAWERYLADVDPAARADVLVRCEDPRHPAVVTG